MKLARRLCSGCGLAPLWALALAGLTVLPAWAAESGVNEAAASVVSLEVVTAPVAVTAALESVAPALESVAPDAAEIDRGKLSWYGRRFHGRRTASGERFDMHALTAAHPTLPFGTRVKVRHLGSGREVEVRINDRGPHVRGRIIDLSRAAAMALGVLHAGDAVVALLPL